MMRRSLTDSARRARSSLGRLRFADACIGRKGHVPIASRLRKRTVAARARSAYAPAGV